MSHHFSSFLLVTTKGIRISISLTNIFSLQILSFKPMTHEEFIATVAKTRSLQKEYFRDRNRSTLDQCKFIEREVDHELEKLLSPVQQTTLF